MSIASLFAAALLTVAAPAPDPAVGHYVYHEAGLEASLDLRPDGSFSYRIDGEPALQLDLRGVWRSTYGDRLELANAPTAPPRFVQTGASYDPAVRAAFTIAVPGGYRTNALALMVDGGSSLQMLNKPGWTLPLFHEQARAGFKGVERTPTARPHKLAIYRASDDLLLATVALTPAGPNRFAFAYTPSAIEPFSLEARRVPDGVEVEFGQGSLTLRRASP